MTEATTVERILRSRALRLDFQPIVDLASEDVVGFEALMRGPAGPLGSPEALIEAAQCEGVLDALDRMARFSALFAVARADLDGRHRLFLNAEVCADPQRFGTELAILDEMAPGVQIVLEVTERASRGCPNVLTRAVETARACGWLVALDDVGPEHASPDLLPVLRPDFVKLDLSVVHQPSSAGATRVLDAVKDYVDESGATLIAEGIEDRVHLRTARSLGAAWGQGWLLGRPGPLPTGNGHGHTPRRTAC